MGLKKVQAHLLYVVKSVEILEHLKASIFPSITKLSDEASIKECDYLFVVDGRRWNYPLILSVSSHIKNNSWCK